jgi:Ala-tRNA(Pro) deacylase
MSEPPKRRIVLLLDSVWPTLEGTMALTNTLALYLADQGVAYDLVPHPRTMPAAPVAADSVAQAVVLRGGDGFMLAVHPASRRIRFEELRKLLGGDVDVAGEEQIETLFTDCEPDAVPALGDAYGLAILVDESLAQQPEIYLECGDHDSLVHISGTSFRKLMANARRGHFSGRA